MTAHFPRQRRAAWLALAALCAATACSQPTSGPVEIAWGRDVCAHCSMVIGDARFAAEVRLGPREIARFDDFGCALAWLAQHENTGSAAEIWVMDQDGGGWLDAREALYRPGQHTPMAWGLGAVAAGEPGALDFEAARRELSERARERASRGGT